MPYYLYILRCGDNSLYTGITTDVARRLAAHQSGKGAKYTRGRGPLTLVYQEELPDKPSALRRELAVKALTEVKFPLMEFCSKGLWASRRSRRTRWGKGRP